MAGTTFWIGQDGNVWAASDAGVTNWGQPTSAVSTKNQLSGIETSKGTVQGRLIADPNAPAAGQTPAPGNPNGNSTPALDTGAVTNTQGTIDQIPGLLNSALASEDTSHTNAVNTFNQQEQTQTGAHDAGTVTNQQNYDSNFMDSIRAGIKGLGGLMAILRGSGAAGGTTDDSVRDTVGGITSDDIRTGQATHDQNQNQLDSALSTFLTDLKGKRQANEDIHTNNRAAITRDSNTQLQDLYGKMAGYYGTAGDTGNHDAWMARAGALTPAIAADTKTQTSAYDTTPIVVHAPNLTAFTAPTQPDVAQAPTDGQVGSGIFTMNSNKRSSKDSSTPAAAPAAPVVQGA